MQGTGTNGRKRIILEVVAVLIIGVLITIDQLTKLYVSTHLSKGQVIDVIKGFFYFTYTINTGAAWSFLAGVPWAQTFFKVLTGFALAGFAFFYGYSCKKGSKWLRISLMLVISGTVGNFIDRLAINGVVDFIGFTFGSYNFPVFNVADSYLTIGVIMLIIYFLFFDNNAVFKKKKPELSENVSSDEKGDSVENNDKDSLATDDNVENKDGNEDIKDQ